LQKADNQNVVNSSELRKYWLDIDYILKILIGV